MINALETSDHFHKYVESLIRRHRSKVILKNFLTSRYPGLEGVRVLAGGWTILPTPSKIDPSLHPRNFFRSGVLF